MTEKAGNEKLVISKEILDKIEPWVRSGFLRELSEHMEVPDVFLRPSTAESEFSASDVLKKFEAGDQDAMAFLRKMHLEDFRKGDADTVKETTIKILGELVFSGRHDALEEVLDFMSEGMNVGLLLRKNTYLKEERDGRVFGGFYGTVLDYACWMRDEKAVSLLLMKGKATATFTRGERQPDGKTLKYPSAMGYLARWYDGDERQERIAGLLLENGGNVFKDVYLTIDDKRVWMTEFEVMLKAGGGMARVALDHLKEKFGNKLSKAMNRDAPYTKKRIPELEASMLMGRHALQEKREQRAKKSL